MKELLWLSPIEALAVALATAGMYVAMVVIVRLLGQRVLSSMSGFDLAAVIAFGAVIGRAALGETPRLGGGLVGPCDPRRHAGDRRTAATDEVG